MTNHPDTIIPEEATRDTRELEGDFEEEQIRLENAHDNYLKAVENDVNRCSSAYVDLARRLWKAAEERDYLSIPGIVDTVTVPEGASLLVRECRQTNFGDESELYVRDSEGKKHAAIFHYLGVEDTPMGAWQAYLLHQLWHCLPLWWHSNYARRAYVCSKEDLAATTLGKAKRSWRTKYMMRRQGSNYRSRDIDALDLAPEILFWNGRYYVSCCYWSEFGGLIREYAELILSDGRMEKFLVFAKKTLFKYDCGVIY
jgi:hypothetical protein